jgi:hypothetical protein
LGGWPLDVTVSLTVVSSSTIIEPDDEGSAEQGDAREVSMTTDTTSKTQQEVRSRPELARQLLARVDRLEARLGDVSLAAEIQLLKWCLVRGHGGELPPARSRGWAGALAPRLVLIGDVLDEAEITEVRGLERVVTPSCVEVVEDMVHTDEGDG